MVTTDLSSSQYASRVRQLMAVARNLRDIGAQAVLDIPRIAVIGGQSAGKSSLVEAVSGIRVPRAAGTCTRCPMEVNLKSRPGPWSCEVSLRFDYDRDGKPLRDVLLIPFGATISSPDDVEIALMRAQAAILNHPNIGHDDFLRKSKTDLEKYRTPEAFLSGTLKFSKNVVCVDVYDEGCPDLSFVDLPGLIQNDERELVDLVEDLVRSNITGECLILVAIPMSDDMENQRSMRLAREVDFERRRTIGVLTKPDTLTKGATSARQKWKEVLSGKEHMLNLGYYCVKLSDDEERARSLPRSQREQAEQRFFESTDPWSELQSSLSGRFGVKNTVADLSTQLSLLLDMALPGLRIKGEKLLAECKESLAQLPRPVTVDASTEILTRVTDFCQHLTATVNGVDVVTDTSISATDGKAFVQKNRATYLVFKKKIRATAPDFRAFADHTKYRKPFYHQADESDDDDGPIENDGAESYKTCGPYNLYDVRRVIKSSIAWELPNNVPFDAKRQLINSFTCLWDVPVSVCYRDVSARLQHQLTATVKQHFDRFPKLQSYMNVKIMEQFEKQKSMAIVAVEAAIKLEKDPLFTQNTHYLDSCRDKWLSHYRHVHHYPDVYDILKPPPMPIVSPAPVNPYAYEAYEECIPNPPSPTTRALTALGELGFKDLSAVDLARLTRHDNFQEELIVMADVRAYFQVAYKRVIDYIPLTIEHALNQGLANSMKTSLLQQLDLGSVEASKRLIALLDEDPNIKAQREHLETRRRRLEQVLLELQKVGV